jgi:hypothetical protein
MFEKVFFRDQNITGTNNSPIEMYNKDKQKIAMAADSSASLNMCKLPLSIKK